MDMVKTLQKLKGEDVEDETASPVEAARAYLFEELYCMYRLNLVQKALDSFQANAALIDALPENERNRMTHLKAQIVSRLYVFLNGHTNDAGSSM